MATADATPAPTTPDPGPFHDAARAYLQACYAAEAAFGDNEAPARGQIVKARKSFETWLRSVGEGEVVYG